MHLFLWKSDCVGDLTYTIRENILGAQVVRIFNSQEKEMDKFSQNNQKFRDYTVNSIKYTTIMVNSTRIFLGSLIVVIIYFGGMAVLDKTMIIGTLVAFLTYATMIFAPLNMLNNVVVTFIQADASF